MKKMIRLCVLALALVFIGNWAIAEFYVVPVAKKCISGVEYIIVDSASNSDSTKDVIAYCPEGKQVIGGGARVSGAITGIAIATSAPDGIIPTAWYAVAHEIVPSSASWTVKAFAICADVP